MTKVLHIPIYSHGYRVPELSKEEQSPAVVVGPLAVHRAVGAYRFEGWQVTHIKSMRAMQAKPLCCFESARQLAEELKGFNWDFEAPSELGFKFDPSKAGFPDMKTARRIVVSWPYKCPKCAANSRGEA